MLTFSWRFCVYIYVCSVLLCNICVWFWYWGIFSLLWWVRKYFLLFLFIFFFFNSGRDDAELVLSLPLKFSGTHEWNHLGLEFWRGERFLRTYWISLIDIELVRLTLFFWLNFSSCLCLSRNWLNGSKSPNFDCVVPLWALEHRGQEMTPRKRRLWNASGLRGGQELYDSEIRLLGIQYGIIIIDIMGGKNDGFALFQALSWVLRI